jgi:hypothetical protein
MHSNNRGPRPIAGRPRGAFRPRGEDLERRALLAITLGGSLPPSLPNIANIPFGVALSGPSNQGTFTSGTGPGAGFATSDLGDINGDGFDDFAVGAPGVSALGTQVSTSPAGNSAVYLVFGSLQAVNGPNVDWNTLTAAQRVGDLTNLGATTQPSPILVTTPPTNSFAYAGVKFTTGGSANSLLGASIAPLGTFGGSTAFIIGAPNYTESGATTPTGRAYIVFASASILTVTGGTINLDAPPTNVPVITITNTSQAGSQTGFSVSSAGNLLGDQASTATAPDVAIGAPGATINGAASGAVYVLPSGQITPTTRTIDLGTVGQTGGPGGIVFAGTAAGSRTGAAVANAGSVDGKLNGAVPLSDLLIGAPSANAGGGAAYLLYGGTNLPGAASIPSGGSVRVISPAIFAPQTTTGTQPTGTVAGATINGSGIFFDATGSSVAGAGDFTNDGFADFLIGSPSNNQVGGYATMFYGQANARINLAGTINISSTNPSVPQVFTATFDGTGTGTNPLGIRTGQSVSAVRDMNADGINEIVIGAPNAGPNNGGAVYVIPGRANPVTGIPDLEGTFSLSGIEASPLQGREIDLGATAGTTATGFGLSVTGSLPTSSQSRTVDNDTIGDVIIGAPGWGVTSARSLQGGAMVVEGSDAAVPVPASNSIVARISAVIQGSNLVITVFGNNSLTPTLNPFRDISTSQPVIIDGFSVTFPPAVLTPLNNATGDVTITVPLTSVGLTTTSALPNPVTLIAQTAAASPNFPKQIVGTTASGPTPTPTPTPTFGGQVTAPGGFVPTSLQLPFGPTQYVPTLNQLSKYDYKAIPLRVALQQFQPTPPFKARINQFFGLKSAMGTFASRINSEGDHGTATLPKSVFTHNPIARGKTITFTHRVAVVPTYRQREHVGPGSAVKTRR